MQFKLQVMFDKTKRVRRRHPTKLSLSFSKSGSSFRDRGNGSSPFRWGYPRHRRRRDDEHHERDKRNERDEERRHGRRKRRYSMEDAEPSGRRRKTRTRTSSEESLDTIVGSLKLSCLPEPVELVERTSLPLSNTEKWTNLDELNSSPLQEVFSPRGTETCVKVERSPLSSPPNSHRISFTIPKRNKLSLNRHPKFGDMTLLRFNFDYPFKYEKTELPADNLSSQESQASRLREALVPSRQQFDLEKPTKYSQGNFFESFHGFERRIPDQLGSSETPKESQYFEDHKRLKISSGYESESTATEKYGKRGKSRSTSPSTRKETNSSSKDAKAQPEELNYNSEVDSGILDFADARLEEVDSDKMKAEIQNDQTCSMSEVNEDQGSEAEAEESDSSFEDIDDLKVKEFEYLAKIEENQSLISKFIEKEKEWKSYSDLLKGQIKDLVICCNEKDEKIEKLQKRISVMSETSSFDYGIISKLEKKIYAMKAKLLQTNKMKERQDES